MKRTNSKEVTARVKQYVEECIKAEAESQSKSEWETVQTINKQWEIWARNGERLENYLTNIYGLFTYYYDDERKLLQEWLEETDEEAEQYDTDKVHELFKSLTARQYYKVCLELMKEDYKERRDSRAQFPKPYYLMY